MDGIAQQLALQVSEQLPAILHQLLERGYDPEDSPLLLECSLTSWDAAGPRTVNNRVQVASVNLGRDITPLSSAGTPREGNVFTDGLAGSLPLVGEEAAQSSWDQTTASTRSALIQPQDLVNYPRPTKRRKEAGTIDVSSPASQSSGNAVQLSGSEGKACRKKRMSENPALQPSTLDKFISGVWDSIYSSVRMDPDQVIEQWQAIETSGQSQPKMLTDTNKELSTRDDGGVFGRMNVLARKVSQTSKTFRSLEVIVQARWVQCFDDRVVELTQTLPREKAKKTAIAEACVDFNWTEKELRNKMAIWRGYHDIKEAGGWSTLIFAGMGLYRFCKYRVSFTEDTFETLRHLRHRFEVAADTLHPRWRTLLGIIGISNERRYTGHPHEWVVCGPGNEAIPLDQTYQYACSFVKRYMVLADRNSQWDKNFSYTHLDESVVDEDAWGEFDPRTVQIESSSTRFKCPFCKERQSSDPTQNSCACFTNLYGNARAVKLPLQVYRTPNGKNNGLLACCPFERGAAVGEFVGLITSGLEGLDVMVGQTDRATYQIWQGKEGNFTRFINHSCEPNSQFERFIWLGKQRIVLVSKGIEAGEEVTVDYGETYWENLDKVCKCNAPNCRYRDRNRSNNRLLVHRHAHEVDV